VAFWWLNCLFCSVPVIVASPQAFQSSKVRILFATDVAARGVDIPGVTTVVNYNFPVQRGK
jgi:hypothetical protein